MDVIAQDEIIKDEIIFLKILCCILVLKSCLKFKSVLILSESL